MATDPIRALLRDSNKAETKRKMAEFARTRSEYHQQRADYWYRIQAECENQAVEIEQRDSGESQGVPRG